MPTLTVFQWSFETRKSEKKLTPYVNNDRIPPTYKTHPSRPHIRSVMSEISTVGERRKNGNERQIQKVIG